MIKNAAAGSSTPSLPPGPSKLPLIGSIHHLMATGGELPHHTLTRLAREHGPVMHLQMGQVGLVVVSSREAAREVMKVQDANFAHRPELTGPKALLALRLRRRRLRLRRPLGPAAQDVRRQAPLVEPGQILRARPEGGDARPRRQDRRAAAGHGRRPPAHA